jgi:hypothetical protein
MVIRLQPCVVATRSRRLSVSLARRGWPPGLRALRTAFHEHPHGIELAPIGVMITSAPHRATAMVGVLLGKSTSGVRRSGLMVILVLLAIVLVATLLSGFLTRVSAHTRTSRWTIQHVQARLAAESVVEELFLDVQRAVNEPGDAIRRALMESPISASPQTLNGVMPRVVPTALQAGGTGIAGGRFAFSPPSGSEWCTVMLVEPVSADPRERSGILRFAATVTMRGQPQCTETVIRDHAFRVARCSPPQFPSLPGPSRSFIFYLDRPEAQLFPLIRLPPGTDLPPLFVPASPAGNGAQPRSVVSLLAPRPGDGIRGIPGEVQAEVDAALQLLSPESMRQRAQYLVDEPRDLMSFLEARLSAPAGKHFHGLIHCTSRETLNLDTARTPVRGRWVISHEGPVDVADLILEDPVRDSVSIVSPVQIMLRGSRIEASLVCSAPDARGVHFTRQSRVRGPIVTSIFPRGIGMSVAELEGCTIASESPSGSEDPAQQERSYACAVSPRPVLLYHTPGSDRE